MLLLPCLGGDAMTRAVSRAFGLCAALLAAAAAPTQQAGPKAVASVTEIMQAMVVPSSNALFDVARRAPASAEEWAVLRNHAILLAESGNLLLIPGRSQETGVWRSSSRAMADAGAAALQAARDEDAEAVIEAGNLIVDSCEVCHEAHWIR
jgi:hypothetical protein